MKHIKYTNERIDKELIGRSIKRIGPCVNATTHIEFECLICNTGWKSVPYTIIGKKQSGCPTCANKNRFITSDLLGNKNKQCSSCGHQFPLTNEYFAYRRRSLNGYSPNCKKCIKNYSKEYRIKNTDKIKIYQDSRSKTIARKAYQAEYQRKRGKQDIHFKMNGLMSSHLRGSLKKQNINKGGRCWEDLVGYSVGKLVFHLESQFEPWMNWNNRGTYCKTTWNDNDQTTWTWNIEILIVVD